MAVKNKPGSSNSNPTNLITGTTVLPIARVKRIIKEDDDVTMCAADATFVIAVAAELFIGHFVKQGLEQANAESRNKVLYQDLANAVKDHEYLEFLQEIVPQTCKFEKAFKTYNDAMKQNNSTRTLDKTNSAYNSEESSDDNCEGNGTNIGRHDNEEGPSNDDLDMVYESGQDMSESNTDDDDDDLDSAEENDVNSDDISENVGGSSPIHNGNNNVNGTSDSELSDAPTSSNENGSVQF